MKKDWLNHTLSDLKYELAAPILSSVLLCLSFTLCWGRMLAVVAFIPLLAAADRSSRIQAFRQGLITGFVFYFVELYWITNAFTDYTDLSGFIINSAMAMLALYLGLYFAVFTCFWQTFRTCNSGKLNLFLPALATASTWIILEDIRAQLLGGFPWHPLGLTQAAMPGVKDLFAYGGVRLISALVMLTNISLYLLLENYFRKQIKQSIKAALLLLPFLTAAVFMPDFKLPAVTPAKAYGPPLQITAIQPNISQADKWRREKRPAIIKKMLLLSKLPDNITTDLMVWPEASLPIFLQKEHQILDKLTEIAKRQNMYLIAGGPGYRKAGRKRKGAIYNSTFMIAPDGNLQSYNKIKLVPFSEINPLATFLPILGKLVPGPDYTPGTGIQLFTIGGHKFAPSICFEGVFPVYTARFFAAGAGFIINQTNDAWFGNSSGPQQHLNNLRLRALENRSYIVRSANTGISAIIDPAGQINKQLPINQQGVIQAKIFPRLKPTFYARHPNLMTKIALLFFSLGLVSMWLKRYRYN